MQAAPAASLSKYVSFASMATDALELLDHRPAAERRLALVGSPKKRLDEAPVPPQRGIVRAVAMLSGRWTFPVLWVLRAGPVRLGQLHRLFPAASKKMLVQTLRELEDERLVYRVDLSERIRHVEYHLTAEARPDLCVLLDQLQRWGEARDRMLPDQPR